ncbi:hypothetical protein PTMSG1_01791 [Pyrenophora teres f. maculata]|nr:hypothetical protein PTMSG1_01791 [Pyrenophora teres f. maculata]
MADTMRPSELTIRITKAVDAPAATTASAATAATAADSSNRREPSLNNAKSPPITIAIPGRDDEPPKPPPTDQKSF